MSNRITKLGSCHLTRFISTPFFLVFINNLVCRDIKRVWTVASLAFPVALVFCWRGSVKRKLRVWHIRRCRAQALLGIFETFSEGSVDHIIYRDYIVNRRFFSYCSLACPCALAHIACRNGSYQWVLAFHTVIAETAALLLSWIPDMGYLLQVDICNWHNEGDLVCCPRVKKLQKKRGGGGGWGMRGIGRVAQANLHGRDINLYYLPSKTV